MNAMASPVAKPERSVCKRCGLQAPAPIVVDGKCANASACDHRVKRVAKPEKRS